MKPITLRAHFDGKGIWPKEPLDLQPDTELLVALLPVHQADREHEEWRAYSKAQLANAYAEDEPEYPLNSIRQHNPDYAGR